MIGNHSLAGKPEQELACYTDQRGEQDHAKCHIGKMNCNDLTNILAQNSRYFSADTGYVVRHYEFSYAVVEPVVYKNSCKKVLGIARPERPCPDI